MALEFDLVVIGSGSAASEAAYRCREAGWRVMVVDARPFGGTCALRGCDPKKVLVGAAEVLERARQMAGKGIAGDLRIDWPALMRFKRSFTDPVPASREDAFQKVGITPCRGQARFTGPNSLRVDSREVRARFILIAAGARPASLGIAGEELLATSDDFLELEELPRRIVFVGGGYIAMEFSHLAARAGAAVTVLHRGSRLLERFDPDLVDRLTAYSRALGIAIGLETQVEAVEKSAQGIVVHAGARSFPADLAVHAAGRVPDIGGLSLETAGVRFSARGVSVDEYLQSVSNPAIYAAGDAAGSDGPPLTPVAGYEGRVAAANMLESKSRRTNYAGVPSVVFTGPPLAAVGLTGQEARKQSVAVDVHGGDSSGWYSSRRTGAPLSAYKTLIGKDGRILGAHILGEHAEDVINIFALAIRAGLSTEQVKEMLWAYPTHEFDIRYMLG